MKTSFIIASVTAVLLLFFDYGFYIAFAIGIFYNACQLYIKLTISLAFREFLLVLYGVNYLLSPALAYNIESEHAFYKMKLDEDAYFSIIIPAFLCLQCGVYIIKSKIFQLDFSLLRIDVTLNENILKSWLLIGIFLYIFRQFLPGELAFFAYLISLIRYVAAFSLFYINKRKYRWYLLLVICIEIYSSLLEGMFHETTMWLVFFLLFTGFIFKYTLKQKIPMAAAVVLLFLFIQSIKTDYRNRTWSGEEEAGLESFSSSTSTVLSSEEGIFGEVNLIGNLTRVNQAWIFASVVDNMDRTQDFQGLNNIKLYLEAALLPRFLAPDKLRAGDKTLFNKFSGHRIGEETSMGMGIFADGYIGYGYIGTLIFAFTFGLIFSLVFKIVEGWSSLSPFFALFLFPILNYAVRPDCETQTVLGHIVKSVVVFTLLMMYYKNYFRKQFIVISKQTPVANN